MTNDDRDDIIGHPFETSPDLVHIPEENEEPDKLHFSFRKLWAFTGPGFLMSIAYLDPGNIESDLQTGSVAQYKLLWVLFWSTVIGLILQLMSVRLGTATGMNLAEVCKREYPRTPRIVLWIMIEIAIIGSDIQEVIGSAIAINILSAGHIPIWAGSLITIVDTFTFLFLESAGLRKLEILFGCLITTMAASFMYMIFTIALILLSQYITVAPDQLEIIKGLAVPWCKDCGKAGTLQMVGIVGAVIMPHNLYLHSALVLSRDIDRTKKIKIKEANLYYAIESTIALLISFVINLFVVAVFASAFSGSEYMNASISTAAKWLEEKYGLGMKIIWGIGILAAGQSSTMTGTYSGQFVMSGFLNIHWPKWRRVLVTRIIAVAPTLLVALFATRELDIMNSWLNVLQSVQLPFALLPVLHFTNSRRIMADFKNGHTVKMVIWVMAILVMVINLYLVFAYVNEFEHWWAYLITTVVMIVYLTFVAYIAIGIDNYLKLKLWLYKLFKRDISDIQEVFDLHISRVYSPCGDYHSF